ncbi:MAG: hypothetical protein KGL75_06560 [Acidobacteriota bacterium]|nr:hypothetical protein [Acidobacteriota bacterium]
MRKRAFFVLATAALLLLQGGSCMSAGATNAQAMHCCRTIPCTPANHGQGCKNAAASQPSSILPAQHVSLHAPTAATLDYPLVGTIRGHAREPFATVVAQQHSPPDLYTLHASLLI